MTILDFGFVHQVTVETYMGSGALGDVYAAPMGIPCWVEANDELIRDAQGEQVTATTTVIAGVSTAPSSPVAAGEFAVGSRVTLQSGEVCYVAQAGVLTSAGIGLDLDHAEVHLVGGDGDEIGSGYTPPWLGPTPPIEVYDDFTALPGNDYWVHPAGATITVIVAPEPAGNDVRIKNADATGTVLLTVPAGSAALFDQSPTFTIGPDMSVQLDTNGVTFTVN